MASADARADHAVAECPVVHQSDAAAELDALLDAAQSALEAGRAAEAFTCADRAADLEPESVESHTLRGEALTTLGRFAEGENALRLALAIDPTDMDTVRVLSDFLLAQKPSRSRDDVRTAWVLARRGVEVAEARPSTPKPLVAALRVLVAQAENDLGRADKALVAADAALATDPQSVDARYERGVALLNLLRAGEAAEELRRVLARSADDPFAHYHLGLALEWQGDPAATQHLARARSLAPHEFAPEVDAPIGVFHQEIAAFLEALPMARRAAVASIQIEVAELPQESDLRSVDPPFPPTILGLYRGKPAGAPAAPDDSRTIILYRRNLVRAVASIAQLRTQIHETLAHELGHFDGHDEDDLRRRGME